MKTVQAVSMAESSLLEVSELSIAYESDSGSVRALDSASLSVRPNELVAIVGESGCGKTTLGLSIIGLLQSPPANVLAGKILYKEHNLLSLDAENIRHYRGTEIAMIFQEPMTSLNPVYRIGSQIEEAVVIRESRQRESSTSRAKRRKEVTDALTMVRIPDPDHIVNRYPFELSGGMRQRVMIAMALAQKPSLLIADEPTTALDVTTQAQVLKLMRNLMDEVKTSILLITHDLALAAQVADRIAVMYGGQIVEEAEVDELFSNPQHPYTQGLLACIPTGSKELAKLNPIKGSVADLRTLPVGCKFASRCPYVMEICREKTPMLVATRGGHKVACYLY